METHLPYVEYGVYPELLYYVGSDVMKLLAELFRRVGNPRQLVLSDIREALFLP